MSRDVPLIVIEEMKVRVRLFFYRQLVHIAATYHVGLAD